MNEPWRGIFTIVATPYTSSYEFDEVSMKKQIQFLLDAGVNGLVGPAFASEFGVLSDDERKRWIEVVVGEAAGQVPVVATTHSVHTVPAVAMSRWAEGIGADGVMLMPPHLFHFDSAGCYQHYQALSDALTVPIIVQNMIGPIGTPLGSEMLARLCQELAHVKYIKEETLPEPRKIAQTIAAAGDSCAGVFGGRGGQHIVDEFVRGAAGNMPGAVNADALVKLWKKLEEGNLDEARALHNRLLPLISAPMALGGASVIQETLHRRGLFATNLSRMPGGPLSDEDRNELSRLLAEVEDILAGLD
ncbi:dihydrodipicolinate synthase family protein [Chloroflexi bacterium TSY]|nr:dihydrodipicolinate synthase family protein [Chloroflexi bacterium TSY]